MQPATEGRSQPFISLVQQSGDNHIIICEDDGEGVPVEKKERIFDPGFGNNTGLGLAISREILDFTGITIRETGDTGQRCTV